MMAGVGAGKRMDKPAEEPVERSLESRAQGIARIRGAARASSGIAARTKGPHEVRALSHTERPGRHAG